jgi:hypothetical protein
MFVLRIISILHKINWYVLLTHDIYLSDILWTTIRIVVNDHMFNARTVLFTGMHVDIEV